MASLEWLDFRLDYQESDDEDVRLEIDRRVECLAVQDPDLFDRCGAFGVMVAARIVIADSRDYDNVSDWLGSVFGVAR